MPTPLGLGIMAPDRVCHGTHDSEQLPTVRIRTCVSEPNGDSLSHTIGKSWTKFW